VVTGRRKYRGSDFVHRPQTEPLRARTLLARLSAIGVGISIDDFGAGYTSLGQLRTLPVDELKIDRSFVATMAHDRNNALIVRSVIDLGHNLKLSIVAEGVEDSQTLDTLASFHWRGTDRQWRHYNNAYIYFAALATPPAALVNRYETFGEDGKPLGIDDLPDLPGARRGCVFGGINSGVRWRGWKVPPRRRLQRRHGAPGQHAARGDQPEAFQKVAAATRQPNGAEHVIELDARNRLGNFRSRDPP